MRNPITDVRRDESLDIAKGFGILLVVLGHLFDGLIVARYFPSSVHWPALWVYVIYLFHMPLFFVVSGHLASGKHRPAGQTVARLLPTIVYPYFLWSILEGLALVYLSRYTTSHLTLASLIRILWNPIVPYWFLYALFLCQVAYLATRRFSHRVQIAAAVVLFLVPLFLPGLIERMRSLILLETVRGFLFFTLGVVSVTQVRQLGRWAAVVSTVLFAVLAFAAYQAQLSGISGTVAQVPIAIAGILATLAWSRLLAVRSEKRWERADSQGAKERRWGMTAALAFLGRYSMSIYVMHIFFTAGVRIALKRLAAHPTALATAIEIAAAMLAGTLLPLGLNWLVSRFHLDAWFGLQHMETSQRF